METVNLIRNISCSVAPETYLEVMKLAERRGVTVSELLRHFIEDGLNSTTPRELRRLNDRLATMEAALIQLYEMAIMNWHPVKKAKGQQSKIPLPWMPEFAEAWKARMKAAGNVTNKFAYDQLKQRIEENALSADHPWDDDNIQDLLRDMWKVDGSWTADEEAHYQEALKARAGIKTNSPKKNSKKTNTSKTLSRQAKPKRV